MKEGGSLRCLLAIGALCWDAAEFGFRFASKPSLQGVADTLDDFHNLEPNFVFLRFGNDLFLFLIQHVGEILVARCSGYADGREYHAPPVFPLRLAYGNPQGIVHPRRQGNAIFVTAGGEDVYKRQG